MIFFFFNKTRAKREREKISSNELINKIKLTQRHQNHDCRKRTSNNSTAVTENISVFFFSSSTSSSPFRCYCYFFDWFINVKFLFYFVLVTIFPMSAIDFSIFIRFCRFDSFVQIKSDRSADSNKQVNSN